MNRCVRWLVIAGCLWGVSSLLDVHVASAQETGLSQAREYFQAGAQAYAVGEYLTAIQAFEQAYRLVPRPAVLFSMAQAARKQYFLEHQPEYLNKAIGLYERYLKEEPQAARKADAVQALSELEPLVAIAASAESDTPAPRSTATAEASPTRVMITDQAAGALIALDDQPAAGAPLIRTVEPGVHIIRATAPGYVDAERKVVAVKGVLVAVDVAQAELPARLIVQARSGAVLSIDGRIQGQCPFPKPIEIAPGSHLITITLSGYVGVSREQVLTRGHTTIIKAPMPRSRQRTTALVMLGAAASAVTAGGVFGYFAAQQQSSAREFTDAIGKKRLTPDDLAQYNSNLAARNHLRTAALASVGLGAGLAVAGALMIVFDGSTVEPETETRNKSRALRFDASYLKATPLLGPGFAGLGAEFAY